MYAMDAKTREEIEKKAEQYEATKNRIKERIKENVKIAAKKLKDVERELLDEVSDEFCENQFYEFLSGENHTEDDAKEILKREIPHDFGPDEDSFKSIHDEIDLLKAWKKKPKPEQLIPKNITVKEATCDTISVSWDVVEGAKNYLVEVDGDEVFWRQGRSSTFIKGGLLPNTEHTFRVLTIHEKMMGEWSNTVKERTKLPPPSNITAKSITWDSITLTWDDDLMASFYQIEVDGSRSLERVTKSSFIKKGLPPETEHTFRVRTVKENSVGGWSDVVKGRSQKAPDFSECVWKECPDNVFWNWKYSVDKKNPRIAAFTGGGLVFLRGFYCTIIGNTHLPLNKVTSWSVKILKSKKNDGYGIYIGVTPFDINQNENENYDKCGWYFYCMSSKLRSGPPHKYSYKEYGPRKGDGEYVHTKDSVGVVMDTAKGELSFALNGVNLGVAYEGIPLDKPLVPCAILETFGDFVELVF